MNYERQFYKGIPLQQVKRSYIGLKARRFTLNGTNQNVWIPCKFLHDDGTIAERANIDFVFRGCNRKFHLAGIGHLYGPYRACNIGRKP